MDWICEKKELLENELHNLSKKEDYLELEENLEEGYLITQIIETAPFSEITPSWNSYTNIESSIELLTKVRIDGIWTPFISYGIWSTDGYNIGVKNLYKDDLVRVTVDRIFVNNDKTADAVQMKVVFRGKNPKLRRIVFSTNGGNDDEVTGDYLKIIDNVPQISQMASGHKDSNRICSPTSVTMVLQYYGKDAKLFDTARGTFDTGKEIYGNWPQNAAYSGEQGMKAYTKCCKSINPIKNLISKNIPVVASVVSQTAEELDGSGQGFPSGHLMVVVGFCIKDGIEYIVVNDPAADTDNEVRRYYRLDQWVKVWRHYIYVILNETKE